MAAVVVAAVVVVVVVVGVPAVAGCPATAGTCLDVGGVPLPLLRPLEVVHPATRTYVPMGGTWWRVGGVWVACGSSGRRGSLCVCVEGGRI